MKLFIDYADNGIWIVSDSIDFPYPRRNACGCPTRLVQDLIDEGHEVVISDAAKLLIDHDLASMPWNKQHFRAEEYVKRTYGENAL